MAVAPERKLPPWRPEYFGGALQAWQDADERGPARMNVDACAEIFRLIPSYSAGEDPGRAHLDRLAGQFDRVIEE